MSLILGLFSGSSHVNSQIAAIFHKMDTSTQEENVIAERSLLDSNKHEPTIMLLTGRADNNRNNTTNQVEENKDRNIVRNKYT